MAKERVNYWTFPALPREDEAIASLIVDEICAMAKVDIKAHTRRREVCEPRQIACYLIRKNTELSLHRIGDILGIDHASVLHGEDVVRTLKNHNKVFAEKWQTLLSRRFRPKFEKEQCETNIIDYEQSKNCEEQN